MKRKLASMILAMCVAAQPAVGMSGTVRVQAAQTVQNDSETKAQGDYTYRELSDGTIEIAHYTGNAEKLVLPAEIDGKKVSRIGDSAFAEQESLKSVEVADGVTALMDYAFLHCKNLEKITLPESVVSIGDHAFLSCGSLRTIKLPDKVKNIGWAAFEGCKSLTSVQLPKKLETLDAEAFGGCVSLKAVSLPENVRQIGEAAFVGCSNLQSVRLPKSIKEIAQSAFAACSRLKNVYYAGSKTARKKVKVVAKGNASLLGARIHYQNAAKSEIFAPKTKVILKSGKDSYKVLSNVSEVAFVKTTRGDSSLVVPESVQIDGVVYDVEAVASGAFANNKKVTKITVKGDIRQISSQAFSGCSKLKTLVIKSRRLRNVGSNVLKGTPANIRIKVPQGEAARYKNMLKGKGLGKKAVISEY